MHVTIQCIHCSRPLKAPPEMAGRMVQCPGCNGQFVFTDDLVQSSSVSEPRRSRSSGGTDDTLSRSMLVPKPGAAAVPSNGLICRLEPRTLRWLELSDQLAEFLGSTID